MGWSADQDGAKRLGLRRCSGAFWSVRKFKRFRKRRSSARSSSCCIGWSQNNLPFHLAERGCDGSRGLQPTDLGRSLFVAARRLKARSYFKRLPASLPLSANRGLEGRSYLHGVALRPGSHQGKVHFIANFGEPKTVPKSSYAEGGRRRVPSTGEMSAKSFPVVPPLSLSSFSPPGRTRFS